MPKAMIVTVGTGETVSHGICYSIKQQNPDSIIFLLTKESEEKTLPIILKDESVRDKKIIKELLSDQNDTEETCFECRKIMDNLINKGYDRKDIVADFTSGTKAMSAGVVLAAIDKKVGTLVYVSGKRHKNGRVISDTERAVTIEPNRIYAEGLFEEAIKLFNNSQFNGCLKIINQAKAQLGDDTFQDKLLLLEKLSRAYSFWDKFYLSEAFSMLENLSDNGLISNWGIKNRIEKNKASLHKEKDNNFCLERIADLLENSSRRGDLECKYDDSVARLYRLIEYAAQFKIAQKGLYIQDGKGNFDTENLAVDKLPANLKDKYLKDRKDNKVKLSGLYQDYELLFDLEDDVGRLFKEGYEKGNFKKLFYLRNYSILAHGFNPISEETYRKMHYEVEKFIKNIFPEIDKLIDMVKFPQIKI